MIKLLFKNVSKESHIGFLITYLVAWAVVIFGKQDRAQAVHWILWAWPVFYIYFLIHFTFIFRANGKQTTWQRRRARKA